MHQAPLSYPQYRKYKNGKSYFRIFSTDAFEEVQVLGGNYLVNAFQVKILPDRNFVFDMLYSFEESWEQITEAEYLEVFKLAIKQ